VNNHTLSAIDQAIRDIAGAPDGEPYASWLDDEGKARSFCFRSGYAAGVVTLAWQLGAITLDQFDKYHEIIRLTERK
jgi:hypothetical protein